MFPDIDPLLLEQPGDCQLLDNQSIIFLEAEHFEWMQNLPISLFINVASMGEMDMPVINRYFEYMRTSTVASNFYCCNREEKTFPDGTVTCFSDYRLVSAPTNIFKSSMSPLFRHPPLLSCKSNLNLIKTMA